MTTKELILQKLDLVPEPVLRAILQLLDAYTQPAAPQAPNTWFDNFFTEIVGAGGRLTAGDTSNPDSFKTRRAKVGGWRDDVSEAEAAEIDAYLAEHLDPMYGYNPSETRS